jgi:hypothetical protein
MSKIETIYKTFTDRNKRTITVGCTDNDIIAEHNNTEVGRFSIHADEVEDGHPDRYIFIHAEIEISFRDCGIATIMFQACEKYYDDFDIVHHFTDDGASFINIMLDKVAKYGHVVKDDERF